MDLRYSAMPTERELGRVKALLTTLEPGDWSWQLSGVDPMSPWLCIDFHARAVIGAPDPDPSFALWRETLAVYKVGPDGAVEEDPMELPT